MKPDLENVALSSDLDFNGFGLLNPGEINDPPGFISTDDPRMSDERFMLPGSVTDASVASNAGIVQSKLSLNGDLPPNFLGHTANHAAPGDEVERMVQKDAGGGYCPLDSNGRMPAANYPVTGVGTVSSVGLSLPVEFNVDPDKISSGAASFIVSWAAAPPLSWFGGKIGHELSLTLTLPGFNTSPFPVSLFPNLDTSKITSGVFNLSRLPIATGVGPSHASGMVPDPGETGEATDYLARSMQYRRMTSTNAYQNVVPDPSIVFMYFQDDQAAITFTDPLEDASLFYRLNRTGTFVEYPGGVLFFDQGDTLEAYAAKAGYTTSDIKLGRVPTRR